MKFFLALLALMSLTFAYPEGLEVEVLTPEVTCERKTQTGDQISVHYRGTLASDGSEFDASYKRGQPLSFAVGAGRVIKGSVAANLSSLVIHILTYCVVGMKVYSTCV